MATPIKLANGVTLYSTEMVRDNGNPGTYNPERASKADVKAAFAGKVDKVYCCCDGCKEKTTGGWDIGRTGKSISIGCVRFNPTQVAAVLRWLKRK